MEKHTHKEEDSLMDILLNENNDKPIILYDENDKPINFEQVAVIPLDDNLYTILKPIDHMENVEDDEAIVFAVLEDEDGETSLEIESDEAIAIKVFDEYYKLLDEQDEKDKKTSDKKEEVKKNDDKKSE